jgi:hypothetical protein
MPFDIPGNTGPPIMAATCPAGNANGQVRQGPPERPCQLALGQRPVAYFFFGAIIMTI